MVVVVLVVGVVVVVEVVMWWRWFSDCVMVNKAYKELLSATHK